jgi:FMN-dependent NADH-azoreductase
MLSFIGLSDATFVHVEGQQISPAEAQAGLQRAREAVGRLAPRARAAA